MVPSEGAVAPAVPPSHGGEAVLTTEPAEGSAAGPAAERELTEREIEILEALGRLAAGGHAEPEIVKPAQAMAAVIRLLLRKRVMSEQEFLDELGKR